MADDEGDLPLCACLPYIPGTSLQEWVLATASLKDDDCSIIIPEQGKKLVCELGSPQFVGKCGIERLDMTDWRVAPE